MFLVISAIVIVACALFSVVAVIDLAVSISRDMAEDEQFDEDLERAKRCIRG